MCQRWRSLVFASSRCLDLQLCCTQKTPVTKILDVWPALPIAISGNGYLKFGVDNITAALEHNDRVCVIHLWGDPTSILLKSAAAMQNSFPALLDLDLRSNEEWVPPLSDSFLAGSAPRLRSIRLYSIPFPRIRTLLSFTIDLIHLDLWNVPDSGYISPELMLTSLSSLIQLKTLRLGFRSWSGPESRNPSPHTHVVLLNLTQLWFQGVSEYLERLVAHIDAPLLYSVRITLSNQLPFDISELPQFINRSEKFKSLNTTRADLCFCNDSVELALSSQTDTETVDGIMLALSISFREPFWPLLLPRLFGLSLPPLTLSQRLDIRMEGPWSRLSRWQHDPQNTQWINLLRPFTAVKNLYLFEAAALRVVPALREVAVAEGSAHNVLPALQNVFLEGLQPTIPVQEAIGRFASARQLSGHPIAVRPWERRR